MSLDGIITLGLCAVNVGAALLFWRNVRKIQNGRRIVRSFAMLACMFGGLAYALVAIGVFPVIPAWLTQWLAAAQSAALFGISLVESAYEH